MKNKFDFNKELLHLYLESDMSQIDFAKKTRQSHSSINHWLNNHQSMTFEKFVDVCVNLNMHVNLSISDECFIKKII